MKNNLFLFLFLFCLTSVQAGQDSLVHKLSSFIKNIDAFTQLYPQEKVYLHFDNTGYFLGETIWFKAYIVVAENKILLNRQFTPPAKSYSYSDTAIASWQSTTQFDFTLAICKRIIH